MDVTRIIKYELYSKIEIDTSNLHGFSRFGLFTHVNRGLTQSQSQTSFISITTTFSNTIMQWHSKSTFPTDEMSI
jgi:hypothetical protein